MSTEFYTDGDGHLWPITGDYCRVCGYPLIKVIQNQHTHPNCE